MNQNVKEYLNQKVREMMDADSCSAEAKAAGQSWLDALGTDKEDEQTKSLMAELEQDVMTIDSVIAFAGSENAAKLFGEEMAKQVEAHAKEIKEAGAEYCDCPACAAALAILEKKEMIYQN